MNEFRGRLIQRIKRTPEVESFRFKTKEPVVFLAGQFLRVIFDANNKQNQELNKYLSFSCAPGKEYIEVTKKLSASEFSQRLKSLKTDDEVLFEGPMGKCVLKDGEGKAGFLAGGIGITPVISMIEDIKNRELDINVILFYSNRNPQEIAFKKELDLWESDNTEIVHTLTDCESADIKCVYGYIDKELILRYTADIKTRPFFIFGPPKMVQSMKNVCLEAGCDQNMIKSEGFMGYE
ncbi:MAG: FAD-dependent oxidoreductase [Candidatus Omnitrophota bacterium]